MLRILRSPPQRGLPGEVLVSDCGLESWAIASVQMASLLSEPTESGLLAQQRVNSGSTLARHGEAVDPTLCIRPVSSARAVWKGM